MLRAQRFGLGAVEDRREILITVSTIGLNSTGLQSIRKRNKNSQFLISFLKFHGSPLIYSSYIINVNKFNFIHSLQSYLQPFLYTRYIENRVITSGTVSN